MATWRFSGSAADGNTWLRNPAHMFAYVEYVSPATGEWRMIAVATRGYIIEQLRGLAPTGDARSVMLPTMVVLPDAEGAELHDALERALDSKGLDMYSTLVEEIG
jgi:hypothetical protein